jgi:hypothetical protein
MGADSDVARDELAAMNKLAAIAAEHSDDPLVLAIAAWLSCGGDAALYAHLARTDNLPGRSPWLEAVLSERNELIRGLGEGVTPKELTAELRDFRTRVFPRTRTLPASPDPESSRRAIMWRILKLRDVDLGEHQIRNILRGHEP